MEPENNKTYMGLSLVTFAAIICAIVFLYRSIERYGDEDMTQAYSQDFFRSGMP